MNWFAVVMGNMGHGRRANDVGILQRLAAKGGMCDAGDGVAADDRLGAEL